MFPEVPAREMLHPKQSLLRHLPAAIGTAGNLGCYDREATKNSPKCPKPLTSITLFGKSSYFVLCLGQEVTITLETRWSQRRTETLLHVAPKSSNSSKNCKFWGTNPPSILAVPRKCIHLMALVVSSRPKIGQRFVLTGNLMEKVLQGLQKTLPRWPMLQMELQDVAQGGRCP